MKRITKLATGPCHGCGVQRYWDSRNVQVLYTDTYLSVGIVCICVRDIYVHGNGYFEQSRVFLSRALLKKSHGVLIQDCTKA